MLVRLLVVMQAMLFRSTPVVRPTAAAKPLAAIEALMALGYQSSEAARAVTALSPMPPTSDEIIRQALKGMMK